MIWSPLFKTLGLCFISILIEAMSATKEGKQWFDGLKRPKYTFPLKVWYLVGAIYYLLFGVVAYRQFASGKTFSDVSIILLVSVMLINGLSNFIAFKYRSLKWFYLIIYPFAMLLFTLILVLWKDDRTSAALCWVYFLWLFYDVYFGYCMWKMNET